MWPYLAIDQRECIYLGVGQNRIDIIVCRHQGGLDTLLILEIADVGRR